MLDFSIGSSWALILDTVLVTENIPQIQSTVCFYPNRPDEDDKYILHLSSPLFHFSKWPELSHYAPFLSVKAMFPLPFCHEITQDNMYGTVSELKC